MSDGVRSDIQLSPASIYANNKEYREDEFHVGVVFDVSEFSRSATEKLLHAQLHVLTEKLVDRDQAQFGLDKYLAMRGLPIYVFEETDVAQVVKEENDAVAAAVEGEALGTEAQREMSADLSTRESDLEAEVQKVRAAEKAAAVSEAVRCECVHGSCRAGEATCSRCERGWTGPHCDTPTSDETLQNVNVDQGKDFTSDGLYQP